MDSKAFVMVNSRMIHLNCQNCVTKNILFALFVVSCWTLSIAQSACEPGYRVQNSTTCTDVNECVEGGHSHCGQLCTNTAGSYHCSCLPGYDLEADKWSCSAQAPESYILFSHGLDISKMDQGGLNINPVLEGVGDVKSFDYHFGTRSLFWIDGRQKAIAWAPIIGGDSGFLIENLKRPKQLAIDWIHHHIYWTDSKTKMIERVDLGGSDRRIVIAAGQGRPNAIAVDPFKGYVFWSTSGRNERLERSNLDGSDYQAIVTSGLEEVVSITLDIIDKRLFWLDNGLSRIESVDYDGTNRKIVMEELGNDLYGLSLFTDHVYWTELTSNTLSQANKYTGHDLVMLRTTYLDTHAKSISVVHPLKQPDTEPTAAVNCSTSGDCPLVISISPPAEAKPFLVITNQNDIQRINFDGTDYLQVATGEMDNLVAMDYDVRDEMVYFADQGRQLIGRVSLTDPTNRQVVVGPEEIDVVEGIAIDWIRRRLYWTDSGRQTISTCHMDGGIIRIIVERNLQHPKAIAVHPALNLVYWSDIAEPAKIEAARSHDGTHRVIVALNVTNPNSITIDYLNNQLIWLDSARLSIEIANLDGTYRSVLTDRNLGQPFAVAEFNNQVWFTEWDADLLIQVDKTSGKKIIQLNGQFNNPSGIQVVHPKSKKIGRINPCLVFNGGCEQICLVAHVNQVICACDAGYNLRPDGVSCSMDECWTGQAQCHPHAICIDKEEGYDCRCEPGYLGDGYFCFAPTTPRSQLIAAQPVTFEPEYPSTHPPVSDPQHFISGGFEPVTTMSKKTIVPNIKKTNTGGSLGSLTPRRSTTSAPRISTTGPPRGRRPSKPGASGGSGASGTNTGAKTGTNNGGSVVSNGPNGTPNVGTPVDEKITNNGSKIGGNGKSGAGGKPGSGNGAAGTSGKNTGNTDQNGIGIGNLYPGVASGPSVTLGYQPTTKYSHFGVCPNEYKYYCLNGGKCTWLVKIEKPSCRCLSNYGGERCLWLEPSYKSNNGATVAAISGGVLLPLIIFVMIVAFVLYRKKKQGKAESLRRASRPEITLQPINFSHSPLPGEPESKNNSASGSGPASFFGSSLSLSGSRGSGSRRGSICTALISATEAETDYTELHMAAVQTRSDPTSPGSPSMIKAVLSRLSDPSSGSLTSETIKLTGNHYQVPKRSNPAIMPKPQFKLTSGVAAMARRNSQNSNSEKDDDEHTYSIANHYVEMNDNEPEADERQSKLSTFMSTMPRLTQNSFNKYMAMDYNYPTASLGRRKHDSTVVYVNTPKKSSSASQVFSSHVQL